MTAIIDAVYGPLFGNARLIFLIDILFSNKKPHSIAATNCNLPLSILNEFAVNMNIKKSASQSLFDKRRNFLKDLGFRRCKGLAHQTRTHASECGESLSLC